MQQMMQQMTLHDVPEGGIFLLEEPHLDGGADWPHKKVAGGKAVKSCGGSYNEPNFRDSDAQVMAPETVVVHPYKPTVRPKLPKP